MVFCKQGIKCKNLEESADRLSYIKIKLWYVKDIINKMKGQTTNERKLEKIICSLTNIHD